MVSVYLFVPNIIGYARVLLGFIGYAYALVDYRVTCCSYMLSQLLDAADGLAARLLGQSSTFGAVLDMVTDRASTTCLMVILARLYPDYILALTALITIDMFSHWYQMYASLLLGLGSHKQVTNPLLRFYYWKPALFVVCSSTEMWYMSWYVLSFTDGPVIVGGMPLVRLIFALTSPICAFKQVANLVQMAVACQALVEYDAKQKPKKS